MRLKSESDALVVGAGPVGLFAALSLVERGLSVQIVDREWRGAEHSYALALHPASLRLLDEYGASTELLEKGHRVERIAFYEGRERVGAVDYSKLGGPFPFVLVVPQSALEETLRKRLGARGVEVLWNHEASEIRQDERGVSARIALMEKVSQGYPVAHTEWAVAKQLETRAGLLVGADGYHSQIREDAGTTFEDLGGTRTFAVYLLSAETDFADEARVVFHEGTVSVAWPMGPERVRFSFQVPADTGSPPDPEALPGLLQERAPWFGSGVNEILWRTTVVFERRLADRFGKDRVCLAGDAAHITGPVGSQSMNVGLREAHDLAARLSAIHKGGGTISLLDEYRSERRAEWVTLLGADQGIRLESDCPPWVREHASEILPCIPASGEQLTSLAGQIGLKVA